MKRYLVEISQEIIVPVVIEAENKQEASEQALISRGIAGDSYYGETKVAQVKPLED